MNNSLQPTILTFKEAMGFLRVSRSTLYRRIWGKEIAPFRVGNGSRLFFYLEDLLAMRQPVTDLKLAS